MMDNWYYILPFLIIYLLLRRYKLRKMYSVTIGEYKIAKLNYLPIIILGLYLLSAISIFFVDLDWYPNFNRSSYNIGGFFIYSIMLSLFLIPSLKFKVWNLNKALPQKILIFRILVVAAILGLFSFFYQLPYAVKGLLIGSLDIRQAMNVEGNFLLPDSWLTTVAVGVSSFYIFYILLFFLAIIYKLPIYLKVAIFLGSLSYILNGFSFMTRDVFIFYPLALIFTFFYLKDHFSLKSIKRFKQYAISIGLFALVLAFIISKQRFTSQYSNDLAYGTIGYFGQQPFVFCEALNSHEFFYHGDLRFSFFKNIYSETETIIRTNEYEWSFGTFLKDFYLEGGFELLFIFAFIFPTFFYLKLVNTSLNFFQRSIVTIFYFQFLMEGLFYFKLGSWGGNQYMLILVLLYVASSFLKNNRNYLIITT